MLLDCASPLATAPNIPVLSGLLEKGPLRPVDGTLHIEQAISGRTRLVLEGGRATRRLFLYGAAFDAELLENSARRPELASLAGSFLREATDALSARPPGDLC